MFVSLTVIVCVCALFVEQISCSAIPVWELLNRDEKISYLYATLTKQIEEYCEFSELENCNSELLKYGRRNLKAMSDQRLDELDPYQRGAYSLIWNSMMEGHAVMKNLHKTTTAAPNTVQDADFGDVPFGTNDLEDFSLPRLDNVYRLPPPKGFVYVPSTDEQQFASGIPEYRQPPPNTVASSKHHQPSSQNSLSDSALVKKYHSATTYEPINYVRQEGPMVVRVYPDGTPVRESTVVVPRDEDYRQYKLTQIRLPRRHRL